MATIDMDWNGLHTTAVNGMSADEPSDEPDSHPLLPETMAQEVAKSVDPLDLRGWSVFCQYVSPQVEAAFQAHQVT